jgi:hypothetical protein
MQYKLNNLINFLTLPVKTAVQYKGLPNTNTPAYYRFVVEIISYGTTNNRNTHVKSTKDKYKVLMVI